MDGQLKVVSPVGEEVSAKTTPLAPRPETLNGKTVCEIWNGGFKADVMFPIIEEMLRARYPDVKMIPFTEFPAVTIASLEAVKKEATLDAVRTAILAKGCDAVITGNGG
jgi:hypothetical protein